MQSCCTWVVVLLQGYLYFYFPPPYLSWNDTWTHCAELGELSAVPASRGVWWSAFVMSHLQHYFFFQSFLIAFGFLKQSYISPPEREALLTWENLVMNCRCVQKQPTSASPCRWAASFSANSEDVLRNKGHLQANYTRERRAALRWDKTLDVGSSGDLWAAENVPVCIS